MTASKEDIERLRKALKTGVKRVRRSASGSAKVVESARDAAEPNPRGEGRSWSAVAKALVLSLFACGNPSTQGDIESLKTESQSLLQQLAQLKEYVQLSRAELDELKKTLAMEKARIDSNVIKITLRDIDKPFKSGAALCGEEGESCISVLSGNLGETKIEGYAVPSCHSTFAPITDGTSCEFPSGRKSTNRWRDVPIADSEGRSRNGPPCFNENVKHYAVCLKVSNLSKN